MSRSYGEFNPALTKAINRVAARGHTEQVRFATHARRAMDDDDFDDSDVMMCLRKGKAHGPEFQNGELRANVTYRGKQIRVSVGAIEYAENDWSKLVRFTVVTVMREV